MGHHGNSPSTICSFCDFMIANINTVTLGLSTSTWSICENKWDHVDSYDHFHNDGLTSWSMKSNSICELQMAAGKVQARRADVLKSQQSWRKNTFPGSDHASESDEG